MIYLDLRGWPEMAIQVSTVFAYKQLCLLEIKGKRNFPTAPSEQGPLG